MRLSVRLNMSVPPVIVIYSRESLLICPACIQARPTMDSTGSLGALCVCVCNMSSEGIIKQSGTTNGRRRLQRSGVCWRAQDTGMHLLHLAFALSFGVCVPNY
jgi:hypothetical protein